MLGRWCTRYTEVSNAVRSAIGSQLGANSFLAVVFPNGTPDTNCGWAGRGQLGEWEPHVVQQQVWVGWCGAPLRDFATLFLMMHSIEWGTVAGRAGAAGWACQQCIAGCLFR